MRRLFWFAIILVSISGCTSNEIGNSKDVNPESIWFDYQVWGEEGNNNVTVKLQYRFAGENGTTLTMDDPAKVELDGEKIEGDSSKMTGAYYEVQKPVSAFTGDHTITFTNINSKQYKEKFSFRPISFLAEIPVTIKRGKIVFQLDGLDPSDDVRILMTDTSFTSEGINRVARVKNGQVIIDETELTDLVNGPIHLELIKEDERGVKNGTLEGGRIAISYGLKREFILKD